MVMRVKYREVNKIWNVEGISELISIEKGKNSF